MATIFNKEKEHFVKCKATACPEGQCGIPWKDYKEMLDKGEVHSGGLPHKCTVDTPTVSVSEPYGVIGLFVVAFVMGWFIPKYFRGKSDESK